MSDRESIRGLKLLTEVNSSPMNLIMIMMCVYYTIPLTTEPSSPENITVINKTCNSLSVQWSPPSDTGGLAIIGYTVDVVNNISSETNVTYTSDTEVKIRATNILGASHPSSATYTRHNGYCSKLPHELYKLALSWFSHFPSFIIVIQLRSSSPYRWAATS